MNGKQKFFICNHCGNIVGLVKDASAPIVCCGEAMTELIPNTKEASVEKHIPEVTVSGNSISVQIGSVPHPMEDAHQIVFIYVETEQGGQRKSLAIGAEPKLSFSFINDKPIAVYSYCNLHGLWKAEVR